MKLQKLSAVSTKHSQPAMKITNIKRRKKQTPMATLEMKLITKEFQKIQQLPKLPTDKHEAKTLTEPIDDPPAVTSAINLPKCITLQPVVNTWKVQVENLRKTVDEKLKETLKESVEQHDNILPSHASPKKLSCRTFSTQTVCADQFKLSDWEQYIVHYNNTHNFERKTKLRLPKTASAVTPKCPLKPSKIAEISTPPVAFEIIASSVEGFDSIDNHINTVLIERFNTINDDDRNENATKPNEAVIDFYKSDCARIFKFLEILQTLPLLWHRRRYGPSIYDGVLKKFLNEFDNTMSNEDFHNSLNNARDFQRRFNALTAVKKSKLANEPELQQYIEKLNNIATLSKSYAYNCDNCSHYFLDENFLFKHKFKRHKIGDISHVCSCGLHFADSIGKDAHEATHKTKPNFACEHCDLSFFSQKKLDNHIVLNHPDAVPNPKPYKCPKCDQSFAKQYILKWHVLKHDPPKYKCETCNKSYHKAFDYKHHMKAHLNQRDFICEECGKGFIAKDILRKHRFKVHKAGQYVCMACKTYFVNYENLHEHMQKYHPDGANLDRKKKQHAEHVKKYHERLKASRTWGPGRKPSNLKCKQCGLEFGRLRQLRQHKRESEHYLGDRRYKCQHCELILSTDQTFVMHLRKVHHLPTKFSDIKYFQPYTGFSEECIEVLTEKDTVHVEYVDAFDEDIDSSYAVHDLSYTDENEPNGIKTIASAAVANYEEVQYSTPSEEEKSECLHVYESNFKIVNGNLQ